MLTARKDLGSLFGRIPTKSTPFPSSAGRPWHLAPLGRGPRGEVVHDFSAHSRVLLTGRSGGGKSNIAHGLMAHACATGWDVYGIDLYKYEWNGFRGKPGVAGIAQDIQSAVDMLRSVVEAMNQRRERMQQALAVDFMDLPGGLPPIMVLVEEAAAVLVQYGANTAAGKKEDSLKEEASALLVDIARRGRATGVFLVLMSQSADDTVLPEALLYRSTCRIVAGYLPVNLLSHALGKSTKGMSPRGPHGRAYIQSPAGETEFQAYRWDRTQVS